MCHDAQARYCTILILLRIWGHMYICTYVRVNLPGLHRDSDEERERDVLKYYYQSSMHSHNLNIDNFFKKMNKDRGTNKSALALSVQNKNS